MKKMLQKNIRYSTDGISYIVGPAHLKHQRNRVVINKVTAMVQKGFQQNLYEYVLEVCMYFHDIHGICTPVNYFCIWAHL